MINKEYHIISEGMEDNSAEFKIIWGDRYLIIKGKNYDTDFHSHHALQISLSLKTSISIISGQERYVGEVILVRHQIRHALEKNEDSVMVLVEPNSIEGQALKRRLQEDEVAVLSLPFELKQMLLSHEFYKREKSSESKQLFEKIVESITGGQMGLKTIDDRISICLNHIKAGLHENDFSVCHLAKVVYLSESRLQHLFKEQVGVSLSSYIQWFMVLKASKHVLEGQSMTYAAHAGGFADLAHFSRAFRGMFGKPLSHYLKNSRMVQVIFV